MLPAVTVPNLSGERFSVTYRVRGSQSQAYARAQDISLEQTVELPDDLVPSGDIRDRVVGKVESFKPLDETIYEVVVSYALETTALELTQLLNIIFGNISMKPGIRVEKISFSPVLVQHFRGPRFGKKGLRALLNEPSRPLLCTALKPLGYAPGDLADLAHKFALGGIDFIKDHHALTNQSFATFRERVERCAAAIAKANATTGGNSIYVPNITAPHGEVEKRARIAKASGAGALLIAPGLVGYDTMRHIASDDSIGLPVFCHPAFLGSFVTSPDNGISHFALFGQIARLAGADVTIYPNSGGRFSFQPDDCLAIAAGASVSMGSIPPIFPCPAGGMSLERVPEMLKAYGKDIVFLIGGGLHKHGPDLVASCKFFREMVSR